MTCQTKLPLQTRRRWQRQRRQQMSSRVLVLCLLSITFLLAMSTLPSTHAAALGKHRRETPTQRQVLIENKSGRRIEVYWINRNKHPNTYHANSLEGEGYPYGSVSAITSYIGHEFEIREMPSKKSKTCKFEQCRKGYFQVNDEEDQEVVINMDFSVDFVDAKIRAQQKANTLLDECQMNILKQEQTANPNQIKSLEDIDPMVLIDQMTDCMEGSVNQTLAQQEEERQFQAKLRKDMAQKLTPYACGDVNFTNTVDVINRTWNFQSKPGTAYQEFQMRVYHERPTSRIFSIANFSTRAECEALQYFVTKDDTTGTSYVPMSTLHDMTKQGQWAARLGTRLYELAKASLSWHSLTPESHYAQHQEELWTIQKDPQGITVLPPCTEERIQAAKDVQDNGGPSVRETLKDCRLPGDTHVQVATTEQRLSDSSKTLVASMFLVCGPPPAQLGGLHFPNAAVHINPEENLLIAVLHRTEPESKLDGFTSPYHFCPNYQFLTHSFYADKELGVEEDEVTTDQTRTSHTSEGEL